MVLQNSKITEIVTGVSMNSWPVDARESMWRLLSTPLPQGDKRSLRRTTYYFAADLLITGADEHTLPIYTRDISAWNLGFILQRALPTGAKGIIRLMAPDGRRTAVGCRFRRCSEFSPGWFDAVAEFCQPQYPFENLG